MRVRGWLLVVVAGGALVETIGRGLGSPPLYLRASVATLVALIGYTLVAGRHSRPLVRWPLLVALVLLTVPAVFRLVRYDETPPKTTFTGGVTFGPRPDPVEEIAQRLFGGLWHAVPAIALYGCLVLAVWFLPSRRRLGVGAVSLVAATAVAALSAWSLWTEAHFGWSDWGGTTSVLLILAYVVPPLLVAVLALAAGVVGGQRAGRWFLTVVGVGLMTVPALLVDGPAQFAGVPFPRRYADVDWAVAYLVATGPSRPSLTPLLYTAGLLLVVVGCVSASRPRLPGACPNLARLPAFG